MTTPRHAKTSRSFRSTLSSIADVISGAGACAAAVESGRRPSNRALKSLGIDADAWDRIGQR